MTPLVSSDNESWGKKAAKGIAFTLGASWVGVGDVASAILNGRDPSVGLFSSAYKTVSDVVRDMSKNQPLSKEHAGKVDVRSTPGKGTSFRLEFPVARKAVHA